MILLDHRQYRNNIPNCQHIPIRIQSNLGKAFLVLYGAFLTGLKHNFIAPNGKISALDTTQIENTTQIEKIPERFKVEASIINNRKKLLDNEERLQNPLKHLRWSFLKKMLTFQLFLQSTS